MKLVILESPYKGKDEFELRRNRAYARRAMHDSLMRGEAPLASHLLYTQPGILKDSDPADRELGIAAGLAWGEWAELTVVYADLGISPGMQHGIRAAQDSRRAVEYRRIGQQELPRDEPEEDETT